MPWKVSVLALSLIATPAVAQRESEHDQMCAGLWYQRNAIFKSAGYCFTTPQAIRAFGNAGCLYDSIEEVPLSDFQREAVAMYSREERNYNCRAGGRYR